MNIERRPGCDGATGDDREVMSMGELHLMRAPRIGHEVMRSDMLEGLELELSGHRPRVGALGV